MKKKKRGRPTVPASQRRKARKLWIPDATWNRWRKQAKLEGISISAWLEGQMEGTSTGYRRENDA